jgi:hypothetical protein
MLATAARHDMASQSLLPLHDLLTSHYLLRRMIQALQSTVGAPDAHNIANLFDEQASAPC